MSSNAASVLILGIGAATWLGSKALDIWDRRGRK
jgi:hypothetical protein